jgi:tellurite resistance-related uncharacterized protein
MDRSIVNFHQDLENHWVADLDCGHTQHVRHNPPLTSRPWVTTLQGREEKIGKTLNCLKCEKLDFPENFSAYKKSPVFTESTIPKALLSNHSTKQGIWAKINVLEGQLKYFILSPIDKEFTLDSTQLGIVLPEVIHKVEPIEKVTFYVEFYCQKSE